MWPSRAPKNLVFGSEGELRVSVARGNTLDLQPFRVEYDLACGAGSMQAQPGGAAQRVRLEVRAQVERHVRHPYFIWTGVAVDVAILNWSI